MMLVSAALTCAGCDGANGSSKADAGLVPTDTTARDAADAGDASRTTDVRSDRGDEAAPDATARLLEQFEGTCRSRRLGDSKLEPAGGRYRLSLTLPDDSRGAAIVPFVQEGRIRPASLTTPEGRTLDLTDEYRHHNYRLLKGFDRDEPLRGPVDDGVAFEWTFLLPYAPRFRDAVHPGEPYELTVRTDRDETPCLYVVGSGGGERIDLNIHLVGVRGFEASDVPDEASVRAMLRSAESIYRSIGLQFGDVRGVSVSPSTERRYEVVRSDAEIAELTALGSSVSGDDRDAYELSVDVFVVRDIVTGSGGLSTLGKTPSLPGPPGLHGHPRTGLVLRGVDLETHPAFVGYALAHELGHYLGLRHTTERVYGTERGRRLDRQMGSTDPVEDTPVCEEIAEGKLESCPDVDNAMFPLAPSPDESISVGFTEGQGETLRVHPIVD